MFAVVTGEHNHSIVAIFGGHNSVTKPSPFLHEAGLPLQLQQNLGMMQKSRAGGACCGSQGEWMLRIPKRNGGNGFLRQTCRHMLRTSAAERLTDPLPTRGGQKLNLNSSSLTCSSLVYKATEITINVL